VLEGIEFVAVFTRTILNIPFVLYSVRIVGQIVVPKQAKYK